MTHIKRLLKQVAAEDPQKRTYAELLARALIMNAVKGNPTAIREILHCVEGPASDHKSVDIEEYVKALLAAAEEVWTGESESEDNGGESR